MKSISLKNRILWAIGSIIALWFFYIMFRYVFFDIHGMKQFPLNMLILGLIVILVAAITYSRKVMICTIVGYIISFLIGMVSSSDYYQYGTRYNNDWKIWMLSYLFFITLGIVLELIIKHKKNRNTHVA